MATNSKDSPEGHRQENETMAGRLHNFGDTHGAGQRIVTTRHTPFGKTIEEGLDADGILKATQTDYEVTKAPATVNGIRIPDTFAVLGRDGQPFQSTVGERHELFQNHEVVQFGQSLIDAADGHLVFVAGGYLKNGAVPWYQLEVPGEVVIRQTELGNDTIKPNIFLLNAHVGESSFLARFVSERPFCNNEIPGYIARALKDVQGTVKLRHTRNMRDRLEEARRVMRAAMGYFEAHVEEMRELDRRAMSLQEMKTFAEDLIGETQEAIEESKRTISKRTQSFRKARVDRLVELFEKGLGNVGRSRYDALQAVAELQDHHVIRRNPETRFRTSVLGENDELKGRALRKLLA